MLLSPWILFTLGRISPSQHPLSISIDQKGVLLAGSSVKNSVKGKSERIGRMLQMHANERTEVSERDPNTPSGSTTNISSGSTLVYCSTTLLLYCSHITSF